MSDFKLHSGDKIAQRMTREGLVNENQNTGETQAATNQDSNHNHQFRENAAIIMESAYDSASQRNMYRNSHQKEFRTENDSGSKESSEQQEQYDYKKKNSSGSGSESANEEFVRYGYEETADNAKDFKVDRYNKKLNKLNEKSLKTEAVTNRLKEKLPYKRRLIYESASDRRRKNLLENGFEGKEKEVHFGRLKFNKTPLSQKEYSKKRANKEKRTRLGRNTVRKGYNKVFEKADEDIKGVSRYGQKGYSYISRRMRKHRRTLHKYYNPYARLKHSTEKGIRLQDKKSRLLEKRDLYASRYKIKSEKDSLKRKTLKKRMQKARIAKEGNRLVRTRRQFARNKKAAAYTVKQFKKILSTILSIGGIAFIIAMVLFALLIIIIAAVNGGTQLYGSTVIQADYDTMSSITAYLKEKETDLEESIQEERIKEYYPDCYEYIFNLGEIGHDPIKLMAYLGAKYGEFTLDMVKAELDSIFEEMYTLIIEIRQEERERIVLDEDGEPLIDEDGNPVTETFMADICYITLEVIPLEEVLDGRMTEEEKAQYAGYHLSSGGQQVYGPVMVENWTNLISSRFGARIHPITGERTFHKGVDIAIPTGTKLYAAVSGTVTISQYSDSAGYYISIKNDQGWIVTYMHMDSLGVSAGTIVKQGDYIGASGNSGRSTGPHLHLEVRNPSEEPVDPTFIIPSTCVTK